MLAAHAALTAWLRVLLGAEGNDLHISFGTLVLVLVVLAIVLIVLMILRRR